MSARNLEPFLQFFEQQSVAAISNDAIEKFADKFISNHLEAYQQKTSALQLPLNFSSEAEEINFLATLHLLGVGGMFEHRSSEASQRCLWEIVLFGIFGAYIGQNTLNSSFMRSQTASDIGQLFSLPMTEPVSLPCDQQASLPFITMEKRGGLADLAELYATVLTDAGSTLQSRGHGDMASLLVERFSVEQDIETLCRDLSSIISSLDDRHFVSVRRTSSSVSPQDTTCSEVMSELCFHKNARRMIHSIAAAASSCSPRWTSVSAGALLDDNTSLAAPSVRGINTLIRLGILTKHPLLVSTHRGCDGDGNGQSEDHDSEADELTDTEFLLRSVTKGGMGSEVALRAVAVVACHKLAEAVQNKLQAGSAALAATVSPLTMSIYLDHVDDKEEITDSPTDTTAISNRSILFIPRESGGKW